MFRSKEILLELRQLLYNLEIIMLTKKIRKQRAEVENIGLSSLAFAFSNFDVYEDMNME